MTRRPTLILFTKAPRYGTGKTRLAARIGKVEALRFQRAQLRHLTAHLGRDPRWRTVLAVSPDQARGPWAFGLPIQSQGRGDLGARMKHGLMAQRPGPVVLIGSDILNVTPAVIARAFKALSHADVAFGPTPDGGFWLIGLSHRRAIPTLFKDARWSSPHTLADCIASVHGRRVAVIDQLADQDE